MSMNINYEPTKVSFQPTRSLIYVDCANEDYRIKLQNWLYRTHIPDSISQFGPYVSKYAFYNALPVPPDGERFGTIKMQLTEHYWLINHLDEHCINKILTEVMPPEVLVWQNNLPPEALTGGNMDGDDFRKTSGGTVPFIFAFVPMWWENDVKGKDRTINDGPNYRWNFCIQYPEGVSLEEGDKWLFEEVFPVFEKLPECTRIVTSKIIKEQNSCPMDRMVEMWFEGPTSWHKCAVEATASLPKPAWAQTDVFPYLKPYYHFIGAFVTDYATSDNLTQYHGYVTMR